MKSGLRFIGAMMLALLSAPLAGQQPDSTVLAAHWHLSTAGQARVHTLAAAAWLQGEADVDDWPAEVESIALRIGRALAPVGEDRKSTRLNSSHVAISYA